MTPASLPQQLAPDRAAHPATDPLLTEAQVAERQQRSIKTLQNQRRSTGGIPFLRLGGSVRYRLSDVLAWEDRHRRASTREAAPVLTTVHTP